MARRRGNNEGSIFTTSDGTWRTQVSIQGKRYSCTAKTRRLCQEWIKNTLKLADNRTIFAGTQKRMDEHLTSWLTNQEPSMRPKTETHYRQLLKDNVLPFIGQITLGNLRAWHIQELYTQLTRQGVGIHTIRKVHKLLQSALESAVEMDILSLNPASSAHPPKEPVSEMKTLDETGINQFLVTISTHKWEPLFYLACTSGMRRGELLVL